MISLPQEVKELLQDAERVQEEAWLNFPVEIDGLEIVQMSLRHYFILIGLDSPFLKSQPFTIADIGVFLWVLSPDFKLGEKHRDEFCKKVARLNVARAVSQIETYLEETFFDADTAEVKAKKRYANFVAYQIDTYAKEYGWSAEYILDLPLRQIFQLNSAIAERYAEQGGDKYTKLRQIDMLEAEALLEEYRKQRNRN